MRTGVSRAACGLQPSWLGFTTMALYRHVPGKAELVDLMRDEAMAVQSSTRRRPRMRKV
ncbi:hypothetical protein [Saccharopolyspora shandongensis]|uniref:hypothetical protein n=1 Tax=Saccharopolyspora shandongensis TaxID=418495 RepID=UPI0033F7E3B0